MKYSVLFIMFFFTEISIFGQCDNSFPGEWKVVSCFNGEVYFNLKTDSTYVTDEIKEMYPDSATQKRFIQLAKDVYGSFVYHFKKNGTFTFNAEEHLIYSGKYCFIPSIQILQETIKNPRGNDETENLKARFENGLFYLSRKWEENKMIELILEKINN